MNNDWKKRTEKRLEELLKDCYIQGYQSESTTTKQMMIMDKWLDPIMKIVKKAKAEEREKYVFVKPNSYKIEISNAVDQSIADFNTTAYNRDLIIELQHKLNELIEKLTNT